MMRNILPYTIEGKKKLFRIEDLIKAASTELFQGPAVHVTPPGKDLELPELLFIVFKNSVHHRKAPLKYVVEPINVQQLGDFLGARGFGAFQRYFQGFDAEKFKVNTHRFRHTLNTLLQRGGMSDALQTEWFGRKKESDTKAYQHMTPAERAWATHQLTGGRHTGEYTPLRPSSRELAVEIAHRQPVLDVGPGWCQHDWRNHPCPRQLDISLSSNDLFWVDNDKKIQLGELERMRSFALGLLSQAVIQLESGVVEATQWIEHLKSHVSKIDGAILQINGQP